MLNYININKATERLVFVQKATMQNDVIACVQCRLIIVNSRLVVALDERAHLGIVCLRSVRASWRNASALY